MADTTAPTAETKAPAPVVKTQINVNGTPLTFVQAVANRGDHKGVPVFLPAYRNDAKVPDLAELSTLVAVLGQVPLLTAFSKTIRNLAVDASIASASKNAEGKFVADPGKFVAALIAEVNDLVSAGKDVLLAERAEIEGKINELFQQIMADYTSGKPLDNGLKNKSLQLQQKRQEILNKLNKKTRVAKAAEPAAK